MRSERIFGDPLEHFTVSNEYRHDLWFPCVRDRGGAYVGVASDQNYTLIAAARSEVAFLVDLDRQVVDLHRIYASLIAAAPDPAAFLALFEPRARKTARAAIAAGLAGDTRAQRSNLSGTTTMADIAVATRALALPVTVLYLSNAEDYLFYTDRFAANVAALPVVGHSALLRTIHDRFTGWDSAGEGDARWHYQVQALPDFQRRLVDRSHGRNQDRTSMLAAALAEGAVERKARGVSVIAPGAADRSNREISCSRAASRPSRRGLLRPPSSRRAETFGHVLKITSGPGDDGETTCASAWPARTLSPARLDATFGHVRKATSGRRPPASRRGLGRTGARSVSTSAQVLGTEPAPARARASLAQTVHRRVRAAPQTASTTSAAGNSRTASTCLRSRPACSAAALRQADTASR